MKLTKKQIAEQCDIPVGRVRYYVEQFPEYFEGIIEKGKRWEVYDINAVDKMKIIASMIKKHTHNEVKTALNEAGYAPAIEMVERDSGLMESGITTTMTRIEVEAMITMLDTQRTIIDHQNAIIDKLKKLLEDKT